MADFIYSTELTVEGPWLLDSSALTELDDILERFWQQWLSRRHETVEGKVKEYISDVYPEGAEPTKERVDEIRKRIEQTYSLDTRKVKIGLGGNKFLRSRTLKEATDQLAASEERPVALRASTTAGDTEVTISVGRMDYGDTHLAVRVAPETSAESRELFGILRQWVRNHQAPRWQQIWSTLGVGMWFLWFLVFFVAAATVPSTESVARRVAQVQADSLLRNGLTEEELPNAVELILRMQTAQVQVAENPGVPAWFWFIIFGSLLATILLSFRPKVVLGMGSGDDSIRNWRRYVKLLGVTIPSVILGSVVVPYVTDLLRRLV